MIITRSTKGKLYLNKKQQEQIDYNLNCSRYIKNHMIERNTKIYKRRNEHLYFYDMNRLVVKMKNYLPWLKQADSQALAYACQEVDNAFNLFFEGKNNYPKYHSKKTRQTYTTKNHIHIDKNKIKIPCIGWLKVRGLKKLPSEAKICNVTIIKEVDETYYISVKYKYTIEEKERIVNINNIIGLDYKSNGFYVDNNGNSPELIHWYREKQTKLIKMQRKLSKKIGNDPNESKSINWIKLHKKIVKLSRKIANQRKDALHKLSKDIANKYDGVGVEDINLKEMAAKNNLKIGKSTLDNGFGEFRIMLDYKFKEQNKTGLIKIDKYYPSSQLCSCCGFKNSEIKDLHIREWDCPNCKTHLDRDINAAINIKNEAIKLIKLKNNI